MNNKGSGLTPAQALDKLDALYEQSVVALRNAIGKYITSGELPDENARKQGLFVYPSLTVTWDGSTTNPPKTRAFGRFTHAGSYTTNRVSSPSPWQRGIGLSSPDVAACRWAQKSLSVEWLNRS